MSIQIRIKVRGKWYKAKKTGGSFEDKCEKCRFKRSCWNGRSIAGYEIRQVCEIFDCGFSQIKTTNVKKRVEEGEAMPSEEHATLMTAAPDLYADERKNQKFLGGLRDFFAVMAEDADIAKIAGLVESMRDWKELLDNRMAEITVLLAKARGEDAE